MEYSYFRAQGQSLAAVKTVIESQRQLQKFLGDIAAQFGAMHELWNGFDRKTGQFDPERIGLHFRDPGKIPAGWKARKPQMSWDGKEIQSVYARPAPGSADYNFILEQAGALKPFAQTAYLDDLFARDNFITRKVPAGEYCRSFVRRKDVIGPFGGYAGRPADAGSLADDFNFCGASNSPMTHTGPLAYKEMNGDFYIQVPNDKSGRPLFTPPDAAPVSYEAMLAADAKEYKKQQARPWDRAPNP